MRRLIGRSWLAACAAATFMLGFAGAGAARAQDEGPVVAPLRTVTVTAVRRSMAQMLRDDATHVVPALGGRAINRPTVDMGAYLATKARAALAGSGVKPVEPDAPPSLKGKNFNGTDQTEAGGGYPPDTHGAAGIDHFFEITNQLIDIRRKSDGVREASVSLNGFFGYFAQPIFDPRVVYDSVNDRWILTAEAFPQSASTQLFFLAVSETSDPLGTYLGYALNVDFGLGANEFFDFPQLGHDKGAILVTANHFLGNTFIGADLLVWNKADTYSGALTSVDVFIGLQGTLAPPVVLKGRKSFLVAAPPYLTGGTNLKLYTLRNSGDPATLALAGPTNVTVPSYSVPPNAPQPAPCTGFANTLDTSDARFANASTQIGTSLFQVHSIESAGFAANRWYQIDASTKTLTMTDLFFAGATSYDFNPSVAANKNGDVFITWSVTDPTLGTDPAVRFSGRLATDPADIPSGTALFTSSNCITGNFDPNRGFQRWGDYSAVTIDPSSSSRAWIVNETVKNANNWGSRIGRIGF